MEDSNQKVHDQGQVFEILLKKLPFLKNDLEKLSERMESEYTPEILALRKSLLEKSEGEERI
jgi:hypothetical protein